jgi:hypothetical protein
VAQMTGRTPGLIAAASALASFLIFPRAYRSNKENLALATIRMIASVPVAMSFLTLSIYIRLVATLLNLKQGLVHLPHNWRETLAVVDCTRPPELLPGAGRVSPGLTFSGYWQYLAGESVDTRLSLSPLLVGLYVPALVYRWSLKASAWLWWPLALALQRPLVDLDERETREHTLKSIKGAWRLLLVFPSVAFAWLLLSRFPYLKLRVVDAFFPKEVSVSATELLSLVSPPTGIFYGLILVSCVLAAVFWYLAKNLEVTHEKLLGSMKEWRDVTGEDKDRFLELARPVEKLRLLFIVSLLFLCEVLCIRLALQTHKDIVEHFIAPWLLIWL